MRRIPRAHGRGRQSSARTVRKLSEDGTFKNDEVSFTVTREFKDMKFVTKYSGKVTDDAITGTVTTERDGKENKRDWEAKRAGKKKD
jgi:hypothetical protein